MNFPKNLRYLRKKSGLRQEDMVKSLKITRSTWSNYEIGHTIPKLTEVVSISKFFGISLDDLVIEDLETVDPLPRKKGQRKKREYPVSDKISKVSEPLDMMYFYQEFTRLRDEVESMKEKEKDKDNDK
jgi:transcriptional regulator with XRE-family HTH domain